MVIINDEGEAGEKISKEVLCHQPEICLCPLASRLVDLIFPRDRLIDTDTDWTQPRISFVQFVTFLSHFTIDTPRNEKIRVLFDAFGISSSSRMGNKSFLKSVLDLVYGDNTDAIIIDAMVENIIQEYNDGEITIPPSVFHEIITDLDLESRLTILF